MKAAIIGATGFGGIELIRLLQNHPTVDVYSIHSSSQAGIALSDVYPHAQFKKDLILEDIDPVEISKNVDIVFLATPPGISANLTPKFLKEDVRIIDLSGDYRLKNSETYKKWYKKEAADEESLTQSVYGLPEWFNKDIQNAKLIANPGCYPTATLLGLGPLVMESLVDLNTIIIDAKSGTSGAGRNPSAITHFPEMNDNFRIYKVNQHQHIPEIEQFLSQWSNQTTMVSFSTHLLPITRGIMATIYATATNGTSEEQLINLYKEMYKNSPFVRIRKQGTFPSTKEVYGSNYCDIGITYDERTNRIMIVAVIDNLVKGAAGQAIQNMNIMLGLDEKTGIDLYPVYP
jgi:N-acetyl-gamma-glutamyl-phosphate reductase